MTDDEIIKLVDTVAQGLAQHYSNISAALIAVIKVMQCQAGFDHPAFVAQLAALQASHEELGWRSPEMEKVFEEVFESFSQPPMLPLPNEWLPPISRK